MTDTHILPGVILALVAAQSGNFIYQAKLLKLLDRFNRDDVDNATGYLVDKNLLSIHNWQDSKECTLHIKQRL